MSSASVQSNTTKSSNESGPGAMKSKPNAWSKPLQSKTPPVSTATAEAKASSSKTSTNSSSNNTSTTKTPKSPPNLPALRERFIHSFLQLTGQSVEVTMDSGVVYHGILHTATPFSHMEQQYVLKAATGGKITPGSTLMMDMRKVVQLHGIATAAAQGFLDAEIAHGAAAGSKKGALVQADAVWTQETAAAPSKFRLGNSIAGWDQFQANEQLFNVKGGFDESVYTTVLDTTQVSATDQSKAARLAQEIQSAPHTNFHVAEERNQVLPGSDLLDEEDRYSGVLAPKLNYAQAAGKKLQKTTSASTEAAAPVAVDTEKEEEAAAAAASPAQSVTPKAENTAKDEKPAAKAAESDPTSDEGDAPAKSKLNANAKEFSLSGSAPAFVPPPPPQPAAYLPPQPFAIDPNTGMPIPILQQMPMQPGMMHPAMMNPMHYSMGYRYPPEVMMHQPPQQGPPTVNGGNNEQGDEQQQSQQEGPPPPMHFHPHHPAHHQGYHYPPPPPQNFVRYPVYNNNNGGGGYDGNRRGGRGGGRGRGRGRNGAGRGGRGRGDPQQPPQQQAVVEENGEAPRAEK